MKIALALLLAVSMLAAQNANDTPEAHVAVAKTAAGMDYQNLFNFLCAVPAPRGGGGQRQGTSQGPPPGPPDRSTWYAEPVKVFDNLYFRRADRVLRMGRHDFGRHHRDRHDL